MFRIVGPKAKDLCDAHLRPTRRDLLRVGGAGMLGLSLGSLLEIAVGSSRGRRRCHSHRRAGGGPGWGKAKSIIMVYLQGGPSHLDLWDPKPGAAENIRSTFKNIGTKIPGVNFTEILPKLAQINDRFTMIRSMSYTPNGLFNHTAAIYQMMTGYTTDKVSPSGQLEPPNGQDFPNFGSQIVRLKPPTEPMLPFVMLPRPLQESNVVGKGGSAGFLGKGFDPYTLYPDGDDMDMAKMDHIKVDDLKMRPDVFAVRMQRRAKLRDMINAQMPAVEKAVEKEHLDEYYTRALSLVTSGRARDAFDLSQEADATRDKYGRNTFGQSCLLARRLIEAGTRVVEVIWPKVANSDNHSWDHHADLTKRMQDPVRPAARHRPLRPDRRHGQARHARRHAPGGHRRIRPQPHQGRQHLRQRQHRRRPRPLALLLHVGHGRRRHQARLRPRQERRHRLLADRKPGPPDRNPGHDLPRLRHPPRDDRVQPPQPAAELGESTSRDIAIRVAGAPTRSKIRCPQPWTNRRPFSANRNQVGGRMAALLGLDLKPSPPDDRSSQAAARSSKSSAGNRLIPSLKSGEGPPKAPVGCQTPPDRFRYHGRDDERRRQERHSHIG